MSACTMVSPVTFLHIVLFDQKVWLISRSWGVDEPKTQNCSYPTKVPVTNPGHSLCGKTSSPFNRPP